MVNFAIENAIESHRIYIHPSISFLELDVPKNILEAPGMISASERKMLYFLAIQTTQHVEQLSMRGVLWGRPLFHLRKVFVIIPT